MEKMTKKERGIYLIKKYGYLIVLGLCALVLIIALIASSLTQEDTFAVVIWKISAVKLNFLSKMAIKK